MFGVHQATISMWLSDLRQSTIPAPAEQELRAAYAAGKSTRALATMYGVSQPVVRRWMGHYGIARRSYKQNPTPVQKGVSHQWGDRISAGLLMSAETGKGNKGSFGEKAPNWRGGTKTDPKTGRVYLWSTDDKGYFPRAWTVWKASHPGEEIGKGHVIHHIDSDPTNDSPANLVKLSTPEHVALHRREERDYILALQALLDAAGISYPAKHEIE